ncbi:MAG TPA: hypothetical protein VFI82_01680 [Terriglobales bacterium]|jgi:hypothetical protein|nr:hypothetical protein [Terriglobales bacterium]
MKPRKNPFGKLTARLLVASLAAAALFAPASANAAAPFFQGRFSLPHKVRWGKAMLPAGEYRLRVDNLSAATVAAIQDVESGKTVAMVLCDITEDDKNTKEGNALLISSKGGQRIVHSLKLATVGKVFIFEPALARGQGTIEARERQSVQVVATK